MSHVPVFLTLEFLLSWPLFLVRPLTWCSREMRARSHRHAAVPLLLACLVLEGTAQPWDITMVKQALNSKRSLVMCLSRTKHQTYTSSTHDQHTPTTTTPHANNPNTDSSRYPSLPYTRGLPKLQMEERAYRSRLSIALDTHIR